MFESHDLTPPDDEFVTRLRMIRPTPPRLDRDRLMYLAGQRSVTPARQSRPLWPALTIASWTACAVLVGLAFARPPRIVTETKIVDRVVERVVEVPVVGVVRPESVPVAPRATADVPLPPASLEPPFDLAFLDDLQRPLTALASRPSLFEESTRPVSVASAEPPAVVEPKKSPTYSELRREWLGTGQRPAFPRPLGWF